MFTKRRALLLVSIIIAGTIAVWILLALNCPSAAIALTSRARQLHRLKNRTTFPQLAEFDPQVSLDELLKRGDDSNRWTITRAARIQGEVIDVEYARPEATNCFSPCRRDIHIAVASHKGAAKNEQVIIEVTPNLREWAQSQGVNWSEKTLQQELIGHWCEFAGWLYFDVGHAQESENTAPGIAGNWRATAWEIHPVTEIKVIR